MKAAVLNHYDKLPKTDIIIVTDILNFEKIIYILTFENT